MFLYKSKYETKIKNIDGKINWLACKEICIPGSTSFTYSISEKTSPDFNHIIRVFKKQLFLTKIKLLHSILSIMIYFMLNYLTALILMAILILHLWSQKNILIRCFKNKKIDSTEYIVIPKSIILVTFLALLF